MSEKELLAQWQKEENIAHIHGWDFSHIQCRYTEEENMPWNYREEILRRLSPEMNILDMDTGGGEFLLSLSHPPANTAATEGYPPNVALCRETLMPLGIDFRKNLPDNILPFPDESFHMVLNRHGDFSPSEVWRVLKKGGLFLTQQVGAENDRELVELLLGKWDCPFPEQYLRIFRERLQNAGFTLLDGQETFGPIRFFDVGALVWFARIIEWEFPGFSVEGCKERLMEAQRLLETEGRIEGSIHRFFLAAQKA